MPLVINNIEYLTSKEVCEIYSISNQLLQYWRKKGLKSFSKSLRKMYYTRNDINEFLLGK